MRFIVLSLVVWLLGSVGSADDLARRIQQLTSDPIADSRSSSAFLRLVKEAANSEDLKLEQPALFEKLRRHLGAWYVTEGESEVFKLRVHEEFDQFRNHFDSKRIPYMNTGGGLAIVLAASPDGDRTQTVFVAKDCKGVATTSLATREVFTVIYAGVDSPPSAVLLDILEDCAESAASHVVLLRNQGGAEKEYVLRLIAKIPHDTKPEDIVRVLRGLALYGDLCEKRFGEDDNH